MDAGGWGNWDLEVGEVTVNDFKGRAAMGGVNVGVDNEFSHGEVLVPVALMSASIEAEVLFNILVSTFCLTVGLRVIGSGEVRLNPELSEEGAHDLGGELRSSITNKSEGETMKAENLPEIYVRNSFR